jgi:hypothetical protein
MLSARSASLPLRERLARDKMPSAIKISPSDAKDPGLSPWCPTQLRTLINDYALLSARSLLEA